MTFHFGAEVVDRGLEAADCDAATFYFGPEVRTHGAKVFDRERELRAPAVEAQRRYRSVPRLGREAAGAGRLRRPPAPFSLELRAFGTYRDRVILFSLQP